MRKSPQGSSDPTLPMGNVRWGSPPLVYGSRMNAEHGRLQAGRRVVEVRLLDPQQGHPVLAL